MYKKSNKNIQKYTTKLDYNKYIHNKVNKIIQSNVRKKIPKLSKYYLKECYNAYLHYKNIPEKKKNYRICILLCGGYKYPWEITSCINSFNSNIIDFLSTNAEIDVFISTPVFNKDIENIKNIKKIIVEDIKKPTYIDKKIFKNTDEIKSYTRSFIQLLRVYNCYKCAKKYMENNNISYDFFIRMRPDYFVFKNGLPPVNTWSSNKISAKMRLYNFSLPISFSSCSHFNEKIVEENNIMYDDQFYIVPNRFAERAFSIKYGKFKIISIPLSRIGTQKIIWPETYFKYLWDSHNIRIRPLFLNGCLKRWEKKNKQMWRYKSILEDMCQ